MRAEQTEGEATVVIECPCCHGKGSSWPLTRQYECVMCHGANVIDEERLPEWDHILSSAG